MQTVERGRTLKVRAYARHDLDRGVIRVCGKESRKICGLRPVNSHAREPRKHLVDDVLKARLAVGNSLRECRPRLAVFTRTPALIVPEEADAVIAVVCFVERAGVLFESNEPLDACKGRLGGRVNEISDDRAVN